MSLASRRQVLKLLQLAGATALLPRVVACAPRQSGLPLPPRRDGAWDPIAFNLARARQGAVPAAYLAKIEGPDGISQHLGKHLPFVVTDGNILDAALAANVLPIQWGDPRKGHARHPNAAPTAELPTGHYYDWVDLLVGSAETRVGFAVWPQNRPEYAGRYRGLRAVDPTGEEGRDTVYLVPIHGAARRSEVRVHGHCLTHGEYVDFVTVPG
jgi:hypothetical protein